MDKMPCGLYEKLRRNKGYVIVALVIGGLLFLCGSNGAFALLGQGLVIPVVPPAHNSPPSLTSLPASGARMDGSGTHAILGGNVSSLSIFLNADTWWDWGYTDSCGNVVGLQTISKTGDYYFELTGYDPTKTVFFKFVGENPDGKTEGSVLSFQASGGAVDSYRLTESVAPLAIVGALIFALYGLITYGVQGLLLGGVGAYIVPPALQGLDAMLKAMW